jgi:hypothetical protein
MQFLKIERDNVIFDLISRITYKRYKDLPKFLIDRNR